MESSMTRLRGAGLLAGFACLAGLAGCGQSENAANESAAAPRLESSSAAPIPDSAIRFENIAEQCGIRFVPKNGREAGRFSILESLGTGVAICDFDRDSRPDIIVPGGGTFDDSGQPIGCHCGVFRQHSLLQFDDVAKLCGIDARAAYTHGIAVADFDSDGFDDVVITGYRSVRMFQNAGDGTFIDVTATSGLKQDAWSTSAAFLDVDHDGALDLYVVNYLDWKPEDHRKCLVQGHRDICPPGEFAGQSDFLFHNNGDGTFSETSQDAGLSEGGKGLAVITGDVDLDGDSDIYVANDTTPNFLYLNDGTGKFVESALISGCALGATAEAEGSMGIDIADFNMDGFPDLWVSNYENQSFAMYQSCGRGIFQHVSSITGIAAVGQLYVGFGTAAFDADLDGDEDIFAANGHVMYQTGNAPVRQLPLIYENTRGGRVFRNIAESSGDYGRSTHMGRGVAAGDLDQDGLVDLVVSHTNEPIAVLHNTSRSNGAWLSLELVGRTSNRSAIGAYATVTDRGMPRLRKGGGSYLSSGSNKLSWGIDTTEPQIQVEIHWPSGQRQFAKLGSNSADRIIELENR